jgi:ribosomal protein S18 acetylase RimI-like enzyme
MATMIERLTGAQARTSLSELITLLQDAVDSDASVGFVPPLSEAEAREYWEDVLAELNTPKRLLLVARASNRIIGAVQLELAQRANGRHRAEVQKLMVLREARRQGLGRALMNAVEATACEQNRSLLVLDTRAGDAAEQLYRALGYVEAGRIPQYALGADGALHPTIFFYRLLELIG